MRQKFKSFLSSGLCRPTSVIKYLGANIPLNKFDEISLFEKNFANTIYNLQSTLNFWLVRGLTLSGKDTLLKTLVIPKLIHQAFYLLIHLCQAIESSFIYIYLGVRNGKKLGDYNSAVVLRRKEQKWFDVKQYLTALKLKWIFKIFNENLVSDWKTIENICLKENLLFCVLGSNCKFNSMMMNSLVFLSFSKCTLKTLKCILDIPENITTGTTFLWLDKFVKYWNKPVLYEEFFEAGIYDLFQLKKPFNNLFSYDEIAIIFGMTPNNQSFVEYIKLISALPLEWINNKYPANGLHKFLEYKKKIYLKLSCWDNQVKQHTLFK